MNPPRRPAPAINPNARSILIDRVEAAMLAGVIDLMPDNGHRVDTVELTTGELAVLLRVLFPEKGEADAGRPE